MLTAEKDPYLIARDTKLARLKEDFDIKRLKSLGADIESEVEFFLPVLGHRCRIRLDPFHICKSPSESDISVTTQVLMLDYLTAANPRRPRSFISFADFPEARGYLKPYNGRVLQRLTYTAGATENKFTEAAEKAGGVNAGSKPQRFMFRFFPLFEIQAVRYEADEDFPHSCNMLFSDNALHVLSVESLIVCAEKLVSVMQGKEI